MKDVKRVKQEGSELSKLVSCELVCPTTDPTTGKRHGQKRVLTQLVPPGMQDAYEKRVKKEEPAPSVHSSATEDTPVELLAKWKREAEELEKDLQREKHQSWIDALQKEVLEWNRQAEVLLKKRYVFKHITPVPRGVTVARRNRAKEAVMRASWASYYK